MRDATQTDDGILINTWENDLVRFLHFHATTNSCTYPVIGFIVQSHQTFEDIK